MNTLSPEEVLRFLDIAKETDYYVFFATLLYTGLRRGELLALRWRNLDLEAGKLIVVESAYKLGSGEYIIKEPKTAHSRRGVSMPQSLVELFKKYRVDQELLRIQLGVSLETDDFVFSRTDGSPLNPCTVTHTFSKVTKRAGLHNLRLHDLRHIHATMLLQSGTHPRIVQERLGHSSIATTLDIYSHTVPGMQKAAAERLDSMFPEIGEIENVGKMLAEKEDPRSRPNTSIANPEIESFFELSLLPVSHIGRQAYDNF